MGTTIDLDQSFSLWEKLQEKLKPIDLDDPNGGWFFRGAFFGEPGCGKTVLGVKVSAPGKRIVIFDAENSTEVLKRHPDLKAKSDPFKFPGIRQVQAMIPALDAHPDIDTVMIDSFITCTDAEMRSIAKKEGFKRDHLELYTLQDYGLVLNRWKDLFDELFRSKLNVILNCHVREPNSEEILNEQKKRIAGSDNQAEAIAARFGNILYLDTKRDEKGEKQRFIRTESTRNIFARNRMELPPLITDAQFLAAVTKWRNGEA